MTTPGCVWAATPAGRPPAAMWWPASGKPLPGGESRPVLTDNGAVFTAKQRGEGRVALEVELGVLGVRFDHSRPYHPQTCGKVERFHQTLKKWLAAQPAADSLRAMQRQLDRFTDYYNTRRPHRALDRRTPAQAYAARPKAVPTGIKSPPTTGSATTPSAPAAPSPFGTTADCTTSDSAPNV